jgi:Cd2+/Zn2+-exporting ATPase
MSDDLRRLPYAIRLARRTQTILKQNLAIAFSVMIGLLITSFAAELPLPLAVLGHEGSTVVVILNGLRLLLRRSA